MKTATALFCAAPWIYYGVTWLVYSHDYANVFAVMWLAISPAVTALGLLVANTEGRRNG